MPLKDVQIGDVINIYVPGDKSSCDARILHIPVQQGQAWILERVDTQGLIKVITNSPIVKTHTSER